MSERLERVDLDGDWPVCRPVATGGGGHFGAVPPPPPLKLSAPPLKIQK